MTALKKKKKPVNQVWLHKQFQERTEEVQQIKELFATTVMTKDLKKFQRSLVCNLPLKRDVDGKEILPRGKANYFLMSSSEVEICAKEVKELEALGLIQVSDSPFSCHAMYVPKVDEQGRELPEKRLVVNYKPLNDCLVDHKHPIPSKDHIWQAIQGSHVYSKFDLTKGYWQVALKTTDYYKNDDC